MILRLSQKKFLIYDEMVKNLPIFCLIFLIFFAYISVAYRYRKSISIIELFVSIISIYIGFLATNF